jgi:diguanylate cyclase (GGDEF)-like protein
LITSCIFKAESLGISMNDLERELPELDSVARMQDIQESLRRLERRDWWLWCAAVVVMLVLTLGIISLSVPGALKESDRSFQYNLNLAVRGLVGLVLLFNIYTLYQQVLIKRLRKEMSSHVAQMAGLKIRAEEFHKLSTLDPLTGLYNRRLAEKRLAGEVSRSQRHGHPLTVLMFDLDGFKEINDRFGHAAGDLLLRTFAEKLNAVIRVSDLAVRLGGDEFMVLLPECLPQQVQSLLDRLGSIQLDFQGHPIPVNYSAGCAGYQSGESAQQLVERADQALYQNKRARKTSQAVPVDR